MNEQPITITDSGMSVKVVANKMKKMIDEGNYNKTEIIQYFFTHAYYDAIRAGYYEQNKAKERATKVITAIVDAVKNI